MNDRKSKSILKLLAFYQLYLLENLRDMELRGTRVDEFDIKATVSILRRKVKSLPDGVKFKPDERR